MQHSAAICQVDSAQMGSVEPITTPAGDKTALKLSSYTTPTGAAAAGFELVPARSQEILHTCSRRTAPRAWLTALDWLIFEAKLHPKANLTTMRVAMDLADRMDYRRGIVLYDLAGTAVNLKLDESTIKRHVAYLRELGTLVWLEHGSKRNLRLPGRKYTATATIYGAVIPLVYDTAKGHRLRGTGYETSVVGFTKAGRQMAVDNAVDKAAGRTAHKRLAPPSRGATPHGPVLELGGKGKATRTARVDKRKRPRKTTLGRKVTASLFQAADRLARRLRPLHNWTQKARIGELSWVLVDKLAEGCTEYQVDVWLREISPRVAIGLDWRPDRPHTYIASQLRREQAMHEEDKQRNLDWANRVAPNAAFGAALEETRLQQTGGEQPAVQGLEALDGETRRRMRADAWADYKYGGNPALVLTAYEVLGPTAAYSLYGKELVDMCMKLDANSYNPRIRLH
ncbi:hypothetical protein ACIREO_22620 [Streptomyces sp. NPDC102441]|uniref:hypothetical protein n=1 Tax=Streptomyces sp. NPDC102441 TaxID=3366176 RepID=UPI00382A6ED1